MAKRPKRVRKVFAIGPTMTPNGSNDTPANFFWIGSISKPFTAAAILKLQEEGKLSVHDSLHKFIQNVPADKQGITIHHLLTHSSGLANNYVADGITESTKNPIQLPY